jgi:hypothetical protein
MIFKLNPERVSFTTFFDSEQYLSSSKCDYNYFQNKSRIRDAHSTGNRSDPFSRGARGRSGQKILLYAKHDAFILTIPFTERLQVAYDWFLFNPQKEEQPILFDCLSFIDTLRFVYKIGDGRVCFFNLCLSRYSP